MPSSQQQLFKRFLYAPEPGDDGEWRAFCPKHEDPATSSSPSASFNFDANVWHCMGCYEGGSIDSLIKYMRSHRNGAKPAGRRQSKPQTGKSQKVGTKIKKPTKPLPTEGQVAQWHERLMANQKLLTYVTDTRGLVKETIKELQWGHDGQRFCMPIRDEDGKIVNMRRYSPAAAGKNKMISWGTGYGKARLLGWDVIQSSDEVIFFEGEWDWSLARQDGLPAVSHTAGAMTFDPSWARYFKDKVVTFCYDNDRTGQRGSLKGAKILAPIAQAVYIAELDIDIKGGDYTDFRIAQGRSLEEFKACLETAREIPFGGKRTRPAPPTAGQLVSLEDSQGSHDGEHALEMIVTVAGKQSPPYLVPRDVHATCNQDKGEVCTLCPMFAWEGSTSYNIQPDDPVIMEFLDRDSRAVAGILKGQIGLKCSDMVTYNMNKLWTVEQLIVTNSVEHRTEEQQSPMHRTVLNVGTYKTPVNTAVRVVGRQKPDPKNQRGAFQSWKLEETKTNLDIFDMTPELAEQLRIFRPRKGQSPLDRCLQIAHDLAHNVTHIYGRDKMHVAYDLVYHSVLDFVFQGKRMEKGWLEALVVGDTRTGKSETAIRLAEHYQAGIVKSCEGMSFAGLVGGAQQLGAKQWTITWGAIPLNDRRLVVLDEVSGLKDKDVMENMSSIRSSGKAQITKIATDEASARTRLIWISNPPDGRPLREIGGGGMEVVGHVAKNPEDIARFDFAMSAASEDVDGSLINSNEHEDVLHRFTDELCKALVLWAWSRKADQVYWVDGCEDAVTEAAIELGGRYVPDPPLIQVENVRMKLARIAVAIAARTFSSDSTGELVIVRHQHVEDAVKFLDMIYSMDSFGYARHSKQALQARRNAERYKTEVREFLDMHADDVRHTLLSIGSNDFRPRDFEEIGAMDRVEVQIAIRNLLEWKMIRRMDRGRMRMEPALIEIMREYEVKEHE